MRWKTMALKCRHIFFTVLNVEVALTLSTVSGKS